MALFFFSTLFFAWRAWALLYFKINDDEIAAMAASWLVENGRRLHLDVFWHHTPLEIALGQTLLRFGADPASPLAYRALGWAAQFIAALALVWSPAADRSKLGTWVAGALYLVFYAAASPVWHGFMFSGYSMAGAASVVFFAFALWPAWAGCSRPGPYSLAAGGALGVVALSSPALIPAGVAAFLALVLLRPKGLWQIVGGTVAALALQAVWIALHGSWGGWWEQVVVFNSTVYPLFRPDTRPTAMVFGALGRVLHALLRGPSWERELVLAAGILGGWLWWHADRSARRTLALGLMAAALCLLWVRDFFWQKLPVMCALYACLAVVLGPIAEPSSRKWRAAWGVLVLAMASSTVLAGHHLISYSERGNDWVPGAREQAARLAGRLAKALPPEETIVSLPFKPAMYLWAGRLNGAKGVYYLPWQAAWEFGKSGVRPDNLCSQITVGRPGLIYDDRSDPAVSGGEDWIPACLAAIEKKEYSPVFPGSGGYWLVRHDLLPGLMRALAADGQGP